MQCSEAPGAAMSGAATWPSMVRLGFHVSSAPPALRSQELNTGIAGIYTMSAGSAAPALR
jgi:hypothetical protein